ncbi:MAG: DUF2017 domain-containing protein [Microbacteriaceae bacterium]
MMGFRCDPPNTLTAQFDPAERQLLRELATQLIALLESAAAPADDPVLARLLPDAYPDDADASAEFRRFTSDGIVDRKVHNARALIASLPEPDGTASVVHLNPAAVSAWLRSLTDIRLATASRLGIVDDDDGMEFLNPTPSSDGLDPLRAIYYWLGSVQQSLVEALSQPSG